jgi:class 3 adenylate cyclase
MLTGLLLPHAAVSVLFECMTSCSGPTSSGIGQQLSAAVGELSSKTQAVRAARSAALAELQELQEAYRELQQQHGTLQVMTVINVSVLCYLCSGALVVP